MARPTGVTKGADRTAAGGTARVNRHARWPLAALLLLAGCGRTVWTDPDRILSIEHFHQRSWMVVAPSVPPAQGALAPLIVALHGAGGTGPYFQEQTHLEEAAGPLGFYVVYPSSEGEGWNVGSEAASEAEVDDRQFIRSLTVHLVETLPIDPDRVFLAGFSNGGIFAHYLGAADIDHRFAGIACVCAALTAETPGQLRRSRPLPVVMVNGTSDRGIPWTRESGTSFYLYTPLESAAFWADHNGCGGEPSEEVLPDAGDPLIQVRRLEWPLCAQDAPVVLWAIDQGGHVWYDNAEISISQVVVDFFAGLGG
jgi:polyhydroxybutyrate depolymerase